jgi:hypothetical protein
MSAEIAARPAAERTEHGWFRQLQILRQVETVLSGY